MTGHCPGSAEDRLYCVYLLRCSDGSLYCGIALDPVKRLRQHNERCGSKYTASRLPVEILFATSCRFTRSEAQALESAARKRKRLDKVRFLEETERHFS
ncbi:MAG TPA: GIY-YIG nuclease family protein [Synergistales bacterium]|nr:GIY-YIG nuclease family protein [Synergistales bacterium]